MAQHPSQALKITRRRVLIVAVGGGLAALSVLATLHALWLPLVFNAIERDDPIDEKADALLVQGWAGESDVVERTADLYRQGYGRIVFTTGGRFDRFRNLLGVDTWSEFTRKELLTLGVPETRI